MGQNVKYYVNGTDFDTLFVRKTLLEHGRVWMAGYAGKGNTGGSNIVNRSSPVQNIAADYDWAAITVGMNHMAAITVDRQLWLWGDNTYGQLGQNTVINRSSPVQTVSGGYTWLSAECSQNATHAIKTDGTLWTWGDNSAGQLGQNDIINRSSPVQVGTGTDWIKVYPGDYFALMTKTNGTIWAVGNDAYGQFGRGVTGALSSPVQILTDVIGWRDIACGTNHVAFIKSDKSLWVMGDNTYGQLGRGTNIHRSSPVQVGADVNWESLSAAGSVTAGIKTDGTLWTWGDNTYGQLGDNTVVHKSSPVQTVSGMNDWAEVHQGAYNTLGLTISGGLFMWGRNDFGQLGANNIVHRSSPVQTIMSGYNWSTARVANLTMAALYKV